MLIYILFIVLLINIYPLIYINYLDDYYKLNEKICNNKYVKEIDTYRYNISNYFYDYKNNFTTLYDIYLYTSYIILLLFLIISLILYEKLMEFNMNTYIFICIGLFYFFINFNIIYNLNKLKNVKENDDNIINMYYKLYKQLNELCLIKLKNEPTNFINNKYDYQYVNEYRPYLYKIEDDIIKDEDLIYIKHKSDLTINYLYDNKNKKDLLKNSNINLNNLLSNDNYNIYILSNYNEYYHQSTTFEKINKNDYQSNTFNIIKYDDKYYIYKKYYDSDGITVVNNIFNILNNNIFKLLFVSLPNLNQINDFSIKYNTDNNIIYTILIDINNNNDIIKRIKSKLEELVSTKDQTNVSNIKPSTDVIESLKNKINNIVKAIVEKNPENDYIKMILINIKETITYFQGLFNSKIYQIDNILDIITQINNIVINNISIDDINYVFTNNQLKSLYNDINKLISDYNNIKINISTISSLLLNNQLNLNKINEYKTILNNLNSINYDLSIDKCDEFIYKLNKINNVNNLLKSYITNFSTLENLLKYDDSDFDNYYNLEKIIGNKLLIINTFFNFLKNYGYQIILNNLNQDDANNCISKFSELTSDINRYKNELQTSIGYCSNLSNDFNEILKDNKLLLSFRNLKNNVNLLPPIDEILTIKTQLMLFKEYFNNNRLFSLSDLKNLKNSLPSFNSSIDIYTIEYNIDNLDIIDENNKIIYKPTKIITMEKFKKILYNSIIKYKNISSDGDIKLIIDEDIKNLDFLKYFIINKTYINNINFNIKIDDNDDYNIFIKDYLDLTNFKFCIDNNIISDKEKIILKTTSITINDKNYNIIEEINSKNYIKLDILYNFINSDNKLKIINDNNLEIDKINILNKIYSKLLNNSHILNITEGFKFIKEKYEYYLLKDKNTTKESKKKVENIIINNKFIFIVLIYISFLILQTINLTINSDVYSKLLIILILLILFLSYAFFRIKKNK